MKAIHSILGGAAERFASPLNVHWDTATYYTAFRRDGVFGAAYDAYSTLFTGANEINPEYEPAELYKAIKWAIQSTYTDAPTCNILNSWDYMQGRSARQGCSGRARERTEPTGWVDRLRALLPSARTGARAIAWCPLIHAKAFFFLSFFRVLTSTSAFSVF